MNIPLIDDDSPSPSSCCGLLWRKTSTPPRLEDIQVHIIVDKLRSQLRLYNLLAQSHYQKVTEAKMEANEARDRDGVASCLGRANYYQKLRKEALDTTLTLTVQIESICAACRTLCMTRNMKEVNVTMGDILTEMGDVDDIMATLRMQTKLAERDGQKLSRPKIDPATEEEVEQYYAARNKSPLIQKKDIDTSGNTSTTTTTNESLQENRRATADFG